MRGVGLRFEGCGLGSTYMVHFLVGLGLKA